MNPTVMEALSLPEPPSPQVVLMVLLGGCASPFYTEADLGETREVEVGSVFTISLTTFHGWSIPQLKGTIGQFIDQRREVNDDRELVRFRAEHKGEVGILIPARQNQGADHDFSMQVRVVDSSGESVFERDWWV